LRGPEGETCRVHGRLLAGEVGELVGVSGTTIGQWARHGYMRPSQSADLPHVYAVEDVGEASVVADLLRRGVRHGDIRSAIERLRALGPWPLSAADLATTVDGGRARVVLEEGDLVFVLGERGWQQVAVAPERRAVRVRLVRPSPPARPARP
jgi:DNA-binding transcriptional MerR regulator